MCPAQPLSPLIEHFQSLDDPRCSHLVEHRLLDIIGLTLCAVICGADSWVDIAAYGRAKEDWLRGFLELPHGIPSHDTIARVFAALDAEGVRSHWGIENQLHWVLDVAFQEDASRIRKDHAPANLAVVRHIALKLLRQDSSAKGGVKAKRLQAGSDKTT